jgi:hypothetical protein
MLEKHRETRGRQAWIFRTLMATRASLLAPAHVEALNAIPIEFYGHKEIIGAWKAYIDHLGRDQKALDVWLQRRVELLVDLMSRLATFLGFEFNSVEISKEFYAPKGHAAVESDQEIIRRGFAKIFAGETALPMALKEVPADKGVEELRGLLLQWMKGEIALPVTIKN